MISINTLFSFRWASIFNLCVLALKELNTAIKINKEKNAVIRWSLDTIYFINGNFKNSNDIIKVYIEVAIISLNIYLLIIFSSFFLGGSFIYSILGTS